MTLFPVVVPCSNSMRCTPSLRATSHTPTRSFDIPNAPPRLPEDLRESDSFI